MARMLTSRARSNERGLDTDLALLARLRDGDRGAIGELFERHRGAAKATVVALAGYTADADALVNEAFTSLFEAVDRGAGPTEAFRPYLLQCVRHVVYAESNRSKREAPTDTVPEQASWRDQTARIDEDSVVAAALAALPDRWQAVLWMLEVEGRTTVEVAEVLDLRPNAVAALAYRAREGLKESYLVHHIEPGTDRQCRDFTALLAGYVRSSLRTRDTARVEGHLVDCESCTAALSQLRQLDSQLGRRLAVVFPFGAAAGAATSAAVSGGIAASAAAVRWLAGKWRHVLAGGVAGGIVVGSVALASSGDDSPQAAPPPSTTTIPAKALPPSITTIPAQVLSLTVAAPTTTVETPPSVVASVASPASTVSTATVADSIAPAVTPAPPRPPRPNPVVVRPPTSAPLPPSTQPPPTSTTVTSTTVAPSTTVTTEPDSVVVPSTIASTTTIPSPTTVAPTTTTAPTRPVNILVSLTPARSAPAALNGSVVSASAPVYVFVEDTGDIATVHFEVVGAGGTVLSQLERNRPYDMGGSGPNGARPVVLGSLGVSSGTVQVIVTVTGVDGSSVRSQASVTVLA